MKPVSGKNPKPVLQIDYTLNDILAYDVSKNNAVMQV